MFSVFWNDFKTWLNWYIYDTFKPKAHLELQNMVNRVARNNDEAIDYILRSIDEMIGFLPHKSASYLNGKVVLEIGPGQDIGILLVLLGLGVEKVYVIDPYFNEWDNQFHAIFYEKLHGEVKQRFPNHSFKHLENVIENKSYKVEGISIIKSNLDKTVPIQKESIDISFSNACFEHLEDSNAAIRELSRLTKMGGIGFHQVDMRDHRDFNKPLEFLSFPDNLYKKVMFHSKCCFGNRVRPYEFQQFFENNQFSCVFHPNMFADESYLIDVSTRFSSTYRKIEFDKLKPICGRFFIEKLNNRIN